MKSASLLIAAFLTLILGISAFLVVIAEEEQALVSLKSIGNESVLLSNPGRLAGGIINESHIYTLDQAYTDWRKSDTDCDISSFVVRNQTGNVLTVTTHYVLTAGNGTFTLVDHGAVNTSTSNNTAVDYDYCGTDYLSESWTRNIMDVVVGFFALAMLVISVGIFYQIAKQEGLVI